MANGQARRAVVFAVALVATAVNAKAQEGDIAAGHAFAREACKACHMVEPEERSPRILEIGPAFRDIADTAGMTATAIRVFLTSSQPKVLNLILTPEGDRGCVLGSTPSSPSRTLSVSSADAPADLGREALEKIDIVGTFR
jgi:cytochrome c551/c552